MTARDLCPECKGCGLRIVRDSPDGTAAHDGWAVRAATYRSGHCGIGKHDACLGVYAGTDCTDCTCWCHAAVTVRVWGTFSWRCETCGTNGAAHETEGSAHAAANLHLDRHGVAP